MAVSRDEVLRVAALARLRLDPAEVELFTAQLSSILDHNSVLGRVRGAAPEAGEPVDWPAPQRDDSGTPDALARPPAELAPAWEDGFFAVPRLPALDAALEDAFEDKARAGDVALPRSRRGEGASGS
jgi:aspartyl-tRNA(Asn)/glutamyl-tRNA(Gln) amidotransferase subunit C